MSENQDNRSVYVKKRPKGLKKPVDRESSINYPLISAWLISLIIHLFVLFWFNRGTMGNQQQQGLGELDVALISDTQPAQLDYVTPDTPSLDEQIEFQTGAEQQLSSDSLTQVEFETGEGDFSDISLDLSAAGAAAGTAASTGSWSDLVTAGGSASEGASFFGLEAFGSRFVYVVDRSGSMSDIPMRTAKAELMRSINQLKPGMEFFVMFYSNGFESMPAQGLVPADRANKRLAEQWIEQISSSGGTNPTEAMKKAMELSPDAIWLLSDGKFSESIADEITKMNSSMGISIHTIAFFNTAGSELLSDLAQKNNGEFIYVPEPSKRN